VTPGCRLGSARMRQLSKSGGIAAPRSRSRWSEARACGGVHPEVGNATYDCVAAALAGWGRPRRRCCVVGSPFSCSDVWTLTPSWGMSRRASRQNVGVHRRSAPRLCPTPVGHESPGYHNGADNALTVKSAACSTMPLPAYAPCAALSLPTGEQMGSSGTHSWRVFDA
jgi:hypothetical protein